jgi:hypothetical protein
MHVFTAGRGTRNSPATRSQGISEILSNDSGAHRWTQKASSGKMGGLEIPISHVAGALAQRLDSQGELPIF